MEIYNIGKYENISDRMRRLAVSPPRNAATIDKFGHISNKNK